MLEVVAVLEMAVQAVVNTDQKAVVVVLEQSIPEVLLVVVANLMLRVLVVQA